MNEASTSSKLVFSTFYGRQLELQQLKDSYNQLDNVLLLTLSGCSGTGKSSLVQRFGVEIQGYFASGKADEMVTQPFAALADALTSFCRQVLNGDELERDRMRAAIREAVGDEGQVLTAMIPGIGQLIGAQTCSEGASPIHARHRLQYIFGRFMRAISTSERPVVLHLDDGQWVDQDTLDLLMSLVHDPRLKHLMIILSFSEDEGDEKHALSVTLDQLRTKGQSFVHLNLGNLLLEEVKQMVADSVSLDEEAVRDLVETIFEKTSGNIFYTRALLQTLEQRQILVYSCDTNKWTCDLDRVKEETIADDVVSTVVARLERQSPEVQHVLTTAAYLGTTFTAETLRQLLDARGAAGILPQLYGLLEAAVMEGFLTTDGRHSHAYRFVHDLIAEASMTLLPEEDRDALSLLIGRYLVQTAGDSTHLIFVAVDHLNSVPTRVLGRHMSLSELVELNLQAAQLSMHVSAFSAAGAYLRKGVELMELDDCCWDDHYELCLRLYVMAAEVEFPFGNFALAKHFSEEVIRNAQSFEDKLPAMMALSDGLRKLHKKSAALQVDTAVLNHYGEMPKHCTNINMNFQVKRLKMRLSKTPDTAVLGLPMLTDPVRLSITKFRSKVAVRAYECQNIPLFVLCVVKQVRMALDHGLAMNAACSFLEFAQILYLNFGDEELAKRLVRLSVEILRVTSTKKYEAKVLFAASNYINPWCRPLVTVTQDCSACFKSGMESGDIESGYCGFGLYTVLSYASGLPLAPILTDLSVHLDILQQSDVKSVFACLKALQELILGLTGEGMNVTQLAQAAKRIPRGGAVEMADKYTAYMQLAYFLGDFELADEMYVQAEIHGASNSSFYYVSTMTLFSVLIAAACFRQTSKKKYQARAHASLMSMKLLVKTKGVNLNHKYLLMQAEYSSTFPNKKSEKKTKDDFDKAISAAARVGAQHEAALANALAGEYSVRIGDKFWAKHYYTAAHERFSLWGATAVADRLLRLHGAYIDLGGTADRCMGSLRKGCDSSSSSAVRSVMDTKRSANDCVTLSTASSTVYSGEGSGAFASENLSSQFGVSNAFSLANR